MSQTKRIAILWGVVFVAFAAFTAAFWPVRLIQAQRDPANFLEHAQLLYKKGDTQRAVDKLKTGVEEFRPAYPQPYRLLAELASQTGDEQLREWAEVRMLFYGAQSKSDATIRDADLKRATEIFLRTHGSPELLPHTNAAILRMAVDLTAVFGAGRAVLDMGPAERYALVAIAGGAFRTDGIVGDTGVLSSAEILVQSGGGQGVQRVAHLIVDGRDLTRRERGFHVATLNAPSGQILHWSTFDLFDDVTAADRMAQFLEESPDGCIGAFAVCDDGSVNMTAELEKALVNFGLRLAARVDREPALLGLRYGLAAIGVKGAAPGTALQAWSSEQFNGYAGHPVACGVVRSRSGK